MANKAINRKIGGNIAFAHSPHGITLTKKQF